MIILIYVDHINIFASLFSRDVSRGRFNRRGEIFFSKLSQYANRTRGNIFHQVDCKKGS